jgi:ElaB/YqjD/DUF883 family membrane-anchored ribosome-binding protein
MSLNINTSEEKEPEPNIEPNDNEDENQNEEIESRDEDVHVEKTGEDNENISMILHLGDVILIKDPSNDILNNHSFIIDYIDENIIKMIDIKEFNNVKIKINEDGTLGDNTITSISLVFRNDKHGYSRQHNLLPGTWVNIYFGGDVPVVITGEITNLEEDMIEIKSFPEKEVLYINFAYKGLPLELPIENIEIREKPSDTSEKDRSLVEEEKEVSDKNIPEIDQDNIDNVVEYNVPYKEIKDNIREFILKANEIQFGEELETITQYINVDESQQRYNIDTQTNDLLEEMLSQIPNTQRTNNVLNNVHTMIERFKQLREEFSTFDEHKNVIGTIIKNANWKPLVNDLLHFKTMLYWLVPVAKNVKKVYDANSNDENELGDVSTHYTLNSISEMDNLLKAYKSNDLPDAENKYVTLYSDLNPYFTPFQDSEPEFNSDIIIDNYVLNNLNVVIDNLGNLYSSVVENNIVKSKRFVVEKYNLGLTRLNALQLTGSKFVPQVIKLTQSDSISLKSLLTLPEPAVRFSHITLPGTNIYTKANLNNTFLNYWQLLKKNTVVNNIPIDVNENEETNKDQGQINEDTFLTDIKNFVLYKNDKLRENNNDDMSSKETTYSTYLNKVIPKTRVLFNLMKKNINGKLSLKDVVETLEPFLIYNSDLTYMQYKDINSFLYNKISEYNKRFVERSKIFSNIKKTGSNISNEPSFSSLDTIISQSEYHKQILDDYNENINENKITNSELFTKMIVKDFGNIYNYGVSLQNSFLMLPQSIHQIIEDRESKMENQLKNLSEKDKCANIIIAKQYNTLEELQDDNDKTVYFDKKYDSTNYSIIDEYLNQQTNMSPEEFIEFLTKKIQDKMKLTDLDANYLTETLINGMKKVVNGDYAVVYNDNENKLTYYKRDHNKWVLDANADDKMVGVTQDMLCNFQQKCIDVQEKYESKCESYDVNKRSITKDAYNEIIEEFDMKYQMSREQLEFFIKSKFEYYSGIIDNLNTIQRNKIFKYNNQQFKIGAKTENDEENDIVISPYEKLRNIILGQSDFVKKQNDILRFSLKFTRTSNNEEEDIHWLYCIKTNAKLLPSFLHTLAASFVEDPTNYLKTMERVIKDIGALSDDGDSWVDKHSGYTIRKIDYDIDEGYDEGRRITSREIMEKDAGELLNDTLKEPKTDKKTKKYKNAETIIMVNVIHAFSEFMGIDLQDQQDFILKIANEALPFALPTEEQYRKKVQEDAKKGKSTIPYKTFYNYNILFLSMAAILIGIQTSIPSIKTRRTYPGCVRSFSGYPLEGDGEYGGLKYMGCIAHKIPKAKSVEPWSVLSKSNDENKIADKIKDFIDKYYLRNIDVERKIKEKNEYLLLSPNEFIPVEHELNKWRNFLPPLVPIKMKPVDNISDHFKKDLLRDFKAASSLQREKLLVIQSKIIMFSLGIQEKIQKIIDTKKPLLTNSANEPFVENACCNEKGEFITIDYFFKEDDEIGLYNSNVGDLSNILYDIQAISKAPYLFCRENSKNIYPSLSDKFNEETIYKAFIVFCKFNSLAPTNENLLALCGEKPHISLTDSIKEQIRKLKSDGHHYTNEQFLRLLQIVNRNNIVDFSTVELIVTRITKMRDVIESISNNNVGDMALIPLDLRNHFDGLLDTYDIAVEEDTEEMRKFKNYLSASNTKLKTDLFEFIKNYGNLSQTKMKAMRENISNIMEWSKNKADKQNIYDETTYNAVHFVKEYIINFSKTFPSIILNSVDYDDAKSVQIPKYWGLSKYHANDVRKIITDYYSAFKKFYETSNITNILNSVMTNTNHFMVLVNETPYLNEIKYKDSKTHSIFDERTTKLLFENYFLRSIMIYIRYTDDDSMTVTRFDNEPAEEQPVSSLLIGDKKELKTNIAKLLIAYLNVMLDHKNIINMSYDEVIDVIFKLKESEKDTFTDRLQQMTDEERNADTILKINKLGVWSKGLQKGLTSYVKETYDEEREYMEQFADIENKVKRKFKDVINDQNMDMLVEDYLDEMEVDQGIEDDEYNMRNLTEDYMDGFYDGDEDQDVGYDD